MDIADHEGSSALRRDLEHLSSDAGASLLRALGVKGDEVELRNASDEFRGHCLALTLLGSCLGLPPRLNRSDSRGKARIIQPLIDVEIFFRHQHPVMMTSPVLPARDLDGP